MPLVEFRRGRLSGKLSRKPPLRHHNHSLRRLLCRDRASLDQQWSQRRLLPL